MEPEQGVCLPGERWDDLQYKGLKILQKPGVYTFSADSVLLAAFARLKPGEQAVDLGAGTGVIGILCGARTGARFTFVEAEREAYGLLTRSLKRNGLSCPNHLLDWKDAPGLLGHGRFSAAVCNPPYFNQAASPSPNLGRAAARGRNEGAPSVMGAAKSAGALLKNGGRLFLCYPAGGLAVAFAALAKAGIEPKRLRLVAATPTKAPYLALIEGKKGARPGILFAPTLVLKDGNSNDTPEIRRLYHMDGEE